MAGYLFPGAMYQRFVQVNNVHLKIKTLAPYSTFKHVKDIFDYHPFLKDTNELYQLSLKRYFGFGALLQFMPFSKAREIRKQFSLELEEAILDLQKETKSVFACVNTPNQDPYFSNYSKSPMLESAMVSHLKAYTNPSRLIRLAHELLSAFHIRGAVYNLKHPYKLIIAPFPNDVAQHFTHETLFTVQNFVSNLFRSFINPFRLINGLLFFTQMFLFKILDLKTKQNERSSIQRTIVKGFLGLVFGTIRFPIILCKFAWDLPLTAIRIFLFQPIAHILESVKYAFLHRKEKVVTAQVKAFRAIKKEVNFFEINKPKIPNQYFGVTQAELYRGANDMAPLFRDLSENRYIACQGEAKEIDKMCAELSQHSNTLFKAKKNAKKMGEQLQNNFEM